MGVWLQKIASHLVSFAVDQSQIEIFSQKSRHKNVVDEKILGILKKKTSAGKVKKIIVAPPWQR